MKYFLPVILIVFVAVAGIAIHDQSREVWFDEAFSLQTANILNTQGAINFAEYDVHPPTYYYALAGWLWLNPGMLLHEWARWLSFVFVAIFLVFVYFGSSRLFGREVAFLTTATMAMLSTYIHFGTEIRPYSLVLLFSGMAFYGVIRFSQKKDFISYICAGLPVVIFPFVHYFAAIGGFFFAFFALVLNKKNWKFSVVILVTTILSAISAFLLFAWPQMQRGEAMWFKLSTLESWFSAMSYSFYVPQGALSGSVFGTMGIVFTIIVLAGMVLGLYKLFTVKNMKDSAIVAMILTSLVPFLALVMIPLLSSFGAGFGNLYHHRMFLVVTWMFACAILLCFYEWANAKQLWKQAIGIVVMISLAFLFIGPYADSLHYELERTLKQVPCEGVTIVHESPFSGAPGIVMDWERGCDNRHVVVSDLTPSQSYTAGYDAWDQENIYWDLRLPEKPFYYVKSLAAGDEGRSLDIVHNLSNEIVYKDNGIALLLVN